MEFYDNYMKNISKTPSESYKSLNQATINAQWENTTQLKTIKEQVYPFKDEYTEYECWVNTVSDVSVNTQKIIGDFLDILYKDLNHPLNHRGQKYLYDVNENGSEQVYLCYDKLQPLSQVPKTKIIRCNNFIKWRDEENGAIKQEPIFLGFEMSSTNNQVTKRGTVSQRRLVVLVQGNEDTKKITNNQRFMLGHKKVFKVTEVNDMIMDDINTEDVTLLTMYVEWDSLLPTDNEELNICDYYDNIYMVNIDQDDIEQKQNYKGKLTATVTMNNDIVKVPLTWESDNENIVSIDKDGNYELLGDIGESTNVKCYVDGNNSSYDILKISIVDDYLGEKIIQISPMVNRIDELESVNFNCGVYINGIKQSDIVKCEPNWDNDCFTLEETIDGYKLTNNMMSEVPLKLTFSSGSCEPIIMNIKLNGLF